MFVPLFFKLRGEQIGVRFLCYLRLITTKKVSVLTWERRESMIRETRNAYLHV
jgi:hypothetical protein